MSELLWILGMTLLVGAVSLVGAFSLALKKDTFVKLVFALVAFSAGALMAGALFHLLDEAAAGIGLYASMEWLLAGFLGFFMMERLLRWRHCHETGECHIHPYSYLVLIGDGIHNFIDGLIIAAGFLAGIPFGIVTTMLIIAHEIPQELGDFGVLVHGGFSRGKALFWNLLSQLTAVAGGIAGFLAAEAATGVSSYMLAFAAGGFIYIAASDLIPEMHKEASLSRSMVSFLFLLVGVGFMVLAKALLGG
jgi:zinc and cadmium transporter